MSAVGTGLDELGSCAYIASSPVHTVSIGVKSPARGYGTHLTPQHHLVRGLHFGLRGGVADDRQQPAVLVVHLLVVELLPFQPAAHLGSGGFNTAVKTKYSTGVCKGSLRFTGRGATTYSDEKVANREIRVWHFVIENGY